MLDPEDEANTSKGAEAKAGPKKVVAPEAARPKPCSQNTAEKQEEARDAKRAAAGSASARSGLHLVFRTRQRQGMRRDDAPHTY